MPVSLPANCTVRARGFIANATTSWFVESRLVLSEVPPTILVQDGAFGMDRWDDRLRIDLVRSSLYGFHDPWKPDEQGPLEHTDLGLHEFRFRFQLLDSRPNDDIGRLFAAFIDACREGMD